MSDLSTETARPALVVRRSADGHAGAFATRALAAGEVLSPFAASRRHAAPSRYTVQVDDGVHIELAPLDLAFINHGCAPNVAFDVERMEVVALVPVAADAELRFFYPSTEWEMDEPFVCRCAAATCLRTIRGARWLRPDQFPAGPVAPHIRRLQASGG